VSSPAGLFRIGGVAERSGRTPSSLRYYEQIGLNFSSTPRPATSRLSSDCAKSPSASCRELRAMIERAELVHRWLEDAARCDCPSLDDCPLFEPTRLPERPVALA
jgi:hypothetical protein